jgi:serine/threonine-protein kinase RsbW
VSDDIKRSVQVHIPSEFGFEKVAMEAATAIAKRMGFSPDRVEDLKTAVSEACLNAIEHGNKQDISTQVVVVLTVQPASLEVNVADQGKQPIPTGYPEPGRPNSNRGWGMFLIRHLVDEMAVSSEPDGGNQVRMVIHLDKQRSEEKLDA